MIKLWEQIKHVEWYHSFIFKMGKDLHHRSRIHSSKPGTIVNNQYYEKNLSEYEIM